MPNGGSASPPSSRPQVRAINSTPTFDADEDVVVLRRVPRKKSWLDVMKACPVPMDDLPRRSREMPKKLKL